MPGFPSVLLWQLLVWAPWIGLSRALFWLAEKLPFRWSLIGSAALHFVISLIFAGLHALWFFVVSSNLSPYLGAPATNFGAFRFFFLFWIQVDLLLYWALLGAATSWDSLERLRVRELRQAELRGKLAAAQLQALKLQIRPHFLFNVLNTIVSMQRAGEHDKATRMTVALSDVLRLILASGDEDELPLAREIELLERYIEIEQFRFEDSLRVEMDVQAGLDDCRVPPLLLQPLVENAIRHGGAASAGRTVIVKVASANETLQIEVSNDAAPAAGPGSHGGFGIGLSNIRSRLHELYGEAHELVVRPDGARTLVRIVLPLRHPAASAVGGQP